jgi:hypothetical protein
MTTAVPAMAERMAAPDDGSFDHFAPENVSSVVTWLCSERSGHVTGQIIEAEGGRIAIADGWRSTEGVDKGSRWAPADVGTALEGRHGERRTCPAGLGYIGRNREICLHRRATNAQRHQPGIPC